MPSVKPSNPIIDWGNPITKGLVFDAPFFEGSGTPIELIYKQKGTLNSGVIWVTTPYGKGLSFDGTSGKLTYTTMGKQNDTVFVSCQAIFLSRNTTSGGGFPRLVQKGNQTVGYFEVSFANSGPLLNWQSRWNAGAGNVEKQISWPSGNNNVWQNFIGTYYGIAPSSGLSDYLNGLLQSPSTTVDGSGSRTADSSDITIGNRYLDTARGFDGIISLVRYWDRILTPNEVKQLYTDPWCIYQKPKFRIINSISSVVEGLRGLISFGMIPFGVAAASGIEATGGTITTDGAYTVHKFTSSGTFEVTSGSGDVEVLVVAGGGGGGGGAGRGGGGGGGEAVEDTAYAVSVGSYTVTIGNGGTGGSSASGYDGSKGGDSVFDTITAEGGGFGGGGPTSPPGGDGGCGGGGGGYAGGGTGGTGSAGGNGGNGVEISDGYGGGGGGGMAPENGANGTNTAGGDGGEGIVNTISGSSQVYGSGGGASVNNGTPGTGGTNAGNGGEYAPGGAGPSGTAGTDGYGGGGGGSSDNHNGASGGSGIVIVRYLT